MQEITLIPTLTVQQYVGRDEMAAKRNRCSNNYWSRT